jgi:hypothetical protein
LVQNLAERFVRSPLDHWIYAGVSFAGLVTYLVMYAKGGMKGATRKELLITTAILVGVILVDCWLIVR